MIYEFSPKQDLHGYDKPWAPGDGKNILPVTLADIKASNSYGTWTDNTYVFRGITWTIGVDNAGNVISITANGTATQTTGLTITLTFDIDGSYIVSGCPNGGNGSSTYNLRINVEGIAIASDYGSGATCTATNSVRGYITIYGNYSASNLKFYPMLRLSSETDATFAPYSNISPISGYNIWDPNNAEMIQIYSGYVDADANKLYLHPVYSEYAGEELVGPWMSSMDEYTEEGTPTTGAFVIDFGGEVSEYDITDFQLQTLLDSLGIRRFITSGAMLLNSLMDQAQGRVRSEEELINLSLPIHVIAIGKELPTNLVIKKPVSDVLPGLPGKFIR